VPYTDYGLEGIPGFTRSRSYRYLVLGIPGTGTGPDEWEGDDDRVLFRLSSDSTPLDLSGTCSGDSETYGRLTSMVMAPEMEAALAADPCEVYWLVEISSGTVDERYGEAYYASEENGLYTGRLTNVGSWTNALSDRRYSLEGFSFSVSLADDDRVFSSLVAGRDGHRLRNATVRVKLAAPEVEPAKWYRAFTGRLLGYSMGAPFLWSLRVGVDDLPLRRYTRNTITRADWPGAAEDVLSQAVPIIFGTFDSRETTDKGAVPTLRVEADGIAGTAGYLVSAGVLKSVDRVYKDGVLEAAGWTAETVEVNGKAHTAIRYAVDPGADVAITADVVGLTAAGDGSGDAVLEPTEQLRLLLTNFVYGDWASGAWLADSTAPLDLFSFSECAEFLATEGHEGSLYVGELVRGEDVIDEWCETFGVRMGWTEDGRLALVADDPRRGDYDDEDVWVACDEAEDGGSDLSLDFDAQNALERVTVSFLPDPAEGKLRRKLTVQDTSTGETGAETLTLQDTRGFDYAP
jgi:hypothetical protein